MLDTKFIVENPDIVKKAAEVKNIKCDVDQIVELYNAINMLKAEYETYLAKKNEISKKIPSATNEERPALIAESKEAGEKAKELSEHLEQKEIVLKDLLARVPQIPADNVPFGKSDADNVVIKTVGEKHIFDFEPKSHYDLLIENDWADFEKVAQVAGPRSHALKGVMARLEIAVHMFVMDKLTDNGFTIVSVPAICKPESVMAAGHFPGNDLTIMKDDVYQLGDTGRSLAGTSEITLNALHAGEILKEDDLPILYAGYSSCFRKEAGSAGKDTRGLIRVHQFTKVEQFVICKGTEEESAKWHAKLLSIIEEVMTDLELPYQVIEACTGDMGFNKIRMHDVEAWVPSEEKYRELGSCSTIHDFQARRTNTRYRESGTNKVKFVHTLNNTGIATPRALAPLIENHQTKDGNVRIPEKLRPYMQNKEFLK